MQKTEVIRMSSKPGTSSDVPVSVHPYTEGFDSEGRILVLFMF